MRQAPGFPLPKKRPPSWGRPRYAVCRGAEGRLRAKIVYSNHCSITASPLVGCFCGRRVFVSLKRNEFARSSPCDGPSIRGALAIRMSEVPSTATADSDYPTKPEATKANAMTAPLGSSIRSCANLRQADLGCQLRRSLVQIWTLILTNYDTNLQLN
jgi:hypothetical protein